MVDAPGGGACVCKYVCVRGERARVGRPPATAMRGRERVAPVAVHEHVPAHQSRGM